MIIFSLDGVLADCEHRRHLVYPGYLDQAYWKLKRSLGGGYDAYRFKDGTQWQPDWQAYNEACDKDKAIASTEIVYRNIVYSPFSNEVQIWSGRCESQREKTINWIINNFYWDTANREYINDNLKLRPIGDTTPEYELKEHWYDLHNVNKPRQNIDFVFDADPQSIEMWKRRGVFVFDVNQNKVQ